MPWITNDRSLAKCKDTPRILTRAKKLRRSQVWPPSSVAKTLAADIDEQAQAVA